MARGRAVPQLYHRPPDAGAYWLKSATQNAPAGAVNLAVGFSAEHDGYEPTTCCTDDRPTAWSRPPSRRAATSTVSLLPSIGRALSVTVEEVPRSDIAVRLARCGFKVVVDWVVRRGRAGHQALFGIQRPGFYFPKS
jgi:hypothetical protein